MQRATLTRMLFDDAPSGYFVGITDMPGVRIGLRNCAAFDVPSGHAYYDRIAEASTVVEVEALHDELTSLHLYD